MSYSPEFARRALVLASLVAALAACGPQVVGGDASDDTASTDASSNGVDASSNNADGVVTHDPGTLAGSFAGSVDQVVTNDANPGSPMLSQVGLTVTIAAGTSSDAHISFVAAGTNAWAFDATRAGDTLTVTAGQMAMIGGTPYTVTAPSTIEPASGDATIALRLHGAGSNPHGAVLRGTLIRTQ